MLNQIKHDHRFPHSSPYLFIYEDDRDIFVLSTNFYLLLPERIAIFSFTFFLHLLHIQSIVISLRRGNTKFLNAYCEIKTDKLYR